ncbi:s-norcoclaurine synthase [Phtheirospermum japonicum]|uniref:S-norcoclaurine synthase n=1 Tax=Phtheirospermum japonicum TaxID=374723 RepID=A0A830CYD3_9LAMI|nr:s-norcoclaurine synthase [Phtheirospermum japonicum]
MYGSASEELEVKVPSSEAWKVYSTLKLAKIIEAIPGMVSRIDAHGDGGVGTILHIFLHPRPGQVEGLSYKEKFTVVDNEKRVKVAEMVEGGYLDLGFISYRVRLEVIDKDNESCITRSTIEYEVKDEAATAANFVSARPLLAVMHAVASHLLLNYKNTTTSS